MTLEEDKKNKKSRKKNQEKDLLETQLKNEKLPLEEKEEDEFDKIFKNLFEKNDDLSEKSKLDSYDPILDDLFADKNSNDKKPDIQPLEADKPKSSEENNEEDFKWLEDLIKDLDTKDNQEENSKSQALTTLPSPSNNSTQGKKSFVSKIGNKPRAPAPPPNVAAYGSGKKVVIMEADDTNTTKKRKKLSFKGIKISWKKLVLPMTVLSLIGVVGFVIKYFNHNQSVTHNNVVLEQVYSGDKILVDLSMTSKAGLEAIKKGYLDAQISNLMYNLIKPGEKVIDIGAGFGYYTLYLARLVGAEGHVYSFEARDAVFKLLDSSVAINKMTQVTPLRALLFSDKIKVLVNEVDKNNRSKFGLINLELDHNDLYSNNITSSLAETSKLDDLLEVENISLININAHGSEMNILLGAKRILAKSPRIKIITSWSKYQMSRYINLEAIVQQLMQNNFKFWLIKPSNGTLNPLTSVEQVMQVERGRLLIAKTLN